VTVVREENWSPELGAVTRAPDSAAREGSWTVPRTMR
jgi:hypothetical protein